MAQFYPPLKERVVKSKSAVCTAVDTSPATITQGVYKKWNKNDIAQTVDSVLKKESSII